MLKKVISFFDLFEDKVRRHLSRYPILYSILGGVAIVLFWRGVWHTADLLQSKGGILGFLFYEPVSLILVILILLASGLFVSYFIGDSILMSGLRNEKKLQEKTEREVREEETTLKDIKTAVNNLTKEVHSIKENIDHDN